MSFFLQWIWPQETSDEKLARWQALYEFDYSSQNRWTKVKEGDEGEFIQYFKSDWDGKKIPTNVNTGNNLDKIKVLIGLDNENYSKQRKAILTAGFKAFQYQQLFT